MINRVFNWTLGSFFRTLGRFLFYIVVCALVYFFINNFEVKAASVGITFGNNNTPIEISPFAQFYDNTSGTFYETTTGTDSTIGVYTTNITITQSGYGAGIGFQLNEPLVNGVTYGLTIFMGSNNSNRWFNCGVYYGCPVTIGATPIDSVSRFNSGSRIATTYQTFSNGTTPVYYKDDTKSQYYASTFTYVFTANRGGNAIFLPFNSSNGTQTSYTVFYGYNLTNFGNLNSLTSNDIENAINSSGLASASSVQEVQNSINKLQYNLNELNDTQKETNNKLDDLNSNITSTDTNGAQNQANGFFSNFDDKDYGLSDVITMPLSIIKNITNTSCSPLVLPIPFVNTNVSLPCMYSIYQTYFGDILSIYQTITTGMIAYWVCINMFAMVKGFKDPENDNVEVMEL